MHSIETRVPLRRITVAWLLVAILAVAAGLGGCSMDDASADPVAEHTSVNGSPSTRPELRVSAAATLRRVFEQIEPAFEAAYDVDVVMNFASSGQLQLQIEGGAPADVFASASPVQVDALVETGHIAAGEARAFCSNQVAILVPAGNPAGIRGPADLAAATRLATGDPVHAPHGTSSREWLETIGMWAGIEPLMVYGQNSAQTMDFVGRGEVDAALGYVSEAIGRDDIEIAYVAPPEQYPAVRYMIAPLSDTGQPELAAAFVGYVLSSDGRALLADHGFTPPSP